MIRLGVHTSISGGLWKAIGRAEALGCNTLQMFCHSPRTWQMPRHSDEDIKIFKEQFRKSDIAPVFIHCSYLINLCSPDRAVRSRSVRMLAYELETLERLNAHYLVLHPGRAVGQPLGEAIEIASKGIRDAVKASGVKKRILLENTAGQRGDISSSIENLSEIAQRAGADSIAGICIDTCHAFQAGYNITTTEGVAELLDKVKTLLSPLRIELIHLNDSKRPFSSGLDRHEHIGRGYIGMEGFCRFLNRKEIKGIPLILETPKNTEKDDMENLLKVKALFEDNGC